MKTDDSDKSEPVPDHLRVSRQMSLRVIEELDKMPPVSSEKLVANARELARNSQQRELNSQVEDGRSLIDQSEVVEDGQHLERLLAMSVNEIELPVSRTNFLNNRNITTLADLVTYKSEKIPRRLAVEFSQTLSRFGLRLDLKVDPEMLQRIKDKPVSE